MQALILAGGKGTRLRPLTVYTPKPIVPVLDRPFLLYQIEILRKAGITDITLSLSYQPDKVQQVLGDGTDFGVSLRYLTEPTPMGTGGAYKYAAEHLTETTVVFNGDVLTDLELGELIDFHQDHKAAATLTLVGVDDPSRYGLVETVDGIIKRFIEKPDPASLAGTSVNTINAGIYVLEPSILDLIAVGENRSFEYDVFPEILARELPFFGYVMDGYWLDIGTPASYLQAHRDLLSGKIAPLVLDETEGDSDVATHSEIDSTSVIGSGCVIKPGAQIINSVLGSGVHVDEKAIIEDSVIWSHTRVASAAEVRGSIVGRSCHIGRNATVSQGSVIGDKTTLTDYTTV